MRGRIVIDVADDGGALVQCVATSGFNSASTKLTVEEQVAEVENMLKLLGGKV